MAKKIATEKPPLHDAVCFHCQQAAEKYLKAFLQELSIPIPHTHDLVKLLKLLLPHADSLRSLNRGARFLSDFAVEYRYPGASATGRQAKSALRWAERFRVDILARLKLRK